MYDTGTTETGIDWASLRLTVGLKHTDTGPDGRRGVRCAYCLKIVDWDSPNGHMHEGLVGRGHVAKSKHHLIMNIHNCVPLHEECHEHTKELRLHALAQLVRNVGAARVGKWYVNLWLGHRLGVAPGLLRPPKLVPVWRVEQEYLRWGERLGHIDAYSQEMGTLIARRWVTGKKVSGLEVGVWWRGKQLIDNGYYLDYLCGVFTADVDEVIELVHKEVQ